MTEERLLFDNRKRMFIPLNMNGVSSNDSKFWKTEKILLIFFLIGFAFLYNYWIGELNIFVKIIFEIIYIIFAAILIIIFVMEYPRFKKVYKNIGENDDRTSGIYWGISFIKQTEEGAVCNFISGKIGCFVRLERGSIVGQEEEFLERHREAISDFYQKIHNLGYTIIFISTMEQASKDKRITDLAKKIENESNPYLKDILEKNLAQIKIRAEYNLYETDTLLIYTRKRNLIDTLARDVKDAVNILFGGAYINATIMDEEEIRELHKEENAIEYFNLTNAKADLFEGESKSKIKIVEIELKNGATITIRPEEEKIIERCYEMKKNGKEVDVIKELTEISVKPSKNAPKQGEKHTIGFNIGNSPSNEEKSQQGLKNDLKQPLNTGVAEEQQEQITLSDIEDDDLVINIETNEENGAKEDVIDL